MPSFVTRSLPNTDEKTTLSIGFRRGSDALLVNGVFDDQFDTLTFVPNTNNVAPF